jgi:hypothetical protein
MRRRRAFLLALLATACVPASPSTPPSDPPTEPPPAALAPGQPPDPAALPDATATASPNPQVLRVQSVIIARLAHAAARRFRDTFGEFQGAAPVAYALPVRAGQCYQISVSAEGSGDVVVRLLDPTAVLEVDGRYGAYALIGQRRPICADHDRAWRLEVSSTHGQGRFVVSVLARTGADEIAPSTLRVWGME